MNRNYDVPMFGYNNVRTDIAAYLVPGQVVTEFPYKERSYSAEGALKNGCLLVRGTNEDQARHPPALPADDPDGIMETVASAATDQTFAGSDFDGDIGEGRITPPRAVTLTFGGTVAHFGVIDVLVKGENANGDPLTAVVHFDGATGGTYATQAAFSRVESVFVPAGTDVSGTLTVGVSDDIVEYGVLDVVGICRYIPTKEPAETSGYDHDDEDRITSVHDGRICCNVELTADVNVVAGDPVYVRVVEVGSDIRGQLTGKQLTGGNFARLLNATWEHATTKGSNSVVRIRV
jgi:hypothetical protein